MKYICGIQVGAGGSYAKGDTPEAAVAELGLIVTQDWSALFDIGDKAFECSVYALPDNGDDWTFDVLEGLKVDGKSQAPVGLYEGRTVPYNQLN